MVIFGRQVEIALHNNLLWIGTYIEIIMWVKLTFIAYINDVNNYILSSEKYRSAVETVSGRVDQKS